MLKSPLFVVGVGRSGTSLVHSILAAHSRISMPPETSFLRRFVLRKRLQQLVGAAGVAAASGQLAKDRFVSRLDVNWPVILERGLQLGASNIDKAVYELLLRAQTESTDTLLFGDKDPRCIEHILAIRKIWPDARFICTLRDPRDVLVSKKKAIWSRHRLPSLHVMIGMAQWQLAQDALKTLGGNVVRIIRYETLLEEPMRTVSALCKWLEVDFEPGMMDFADAAAKLVSDDERQWKGETLGPLLSGNHGKWKTELSEREAHLVTLASKAQIIYGNYQNEVTRSGTTWFAWSLTALEALALRMAIPVFKRVFLGR